MSTASIVVNKIVEDRIEKLLKLFKDNPIHKVRQEFAVQYKVTISIETLQKIYEVWEPMKTHANWSVRSKLRNHDWWGTIEELIKAQVKKDVADFIYHHWVEFQKKK